MKAQGPDEYALAHRTGQVGIWLVNVTLVGFVRSYLKSGRAWLGWTVVVLRTFTLLPNFLSGQSLNFQEISALRAIPFLGENVSIAIGTPNPWMLVGQLATIRRSFASALPMAARGGSRRKDSRTLVEAHGGRLWAENVEGGGASLRFTLPGSPAGRRWLRLRLGDLRSKCDTPHESRSLRLEWRAWRHPSA